MASDPGAGDSRSAKKARPPPYVLILEDVDDIANLLRADLSALGYRLLLASFENGGRAVFGPCTA